MKKTEFENLKKEIEEIKYKIKQIEWNLSYSIIPFAQWLRVQNSTNTWDIIKGRQKNKIKSKK